MLFPSLCKRRLIQNLAAFKVCSKSHYTDFHYNHVTRSISSSSTSLSAAKKSVPENGDESSFTVSYLMNSCGLSSQKALSVSKKVHFQTSVKPDSVLTLLRNYGFAEAHVSKLVLKRPDMLLCNAEKILVPKLEFLRSIGLSDDDIARLTSAVPRFFGLSLTDYIIPKYNLLKSLVGTGIEEKNNIVKAISSCRVPSREMTSTNVVPNMSILRELGTPESSILRMITLYYQAPYLEHKIFKEIVDYLMAMGFDPSAHAFIQAINVISGLGESNLEEKFNIYARWGWSKEDARSAFKYNPNCMAYSEKRITKAMDFFVNKMGFSPKLITVYSNLLTYSLETRTIPRCLVAKVLSHNGLIKKDFNLGTLVKKDEKYFMRNYVIKFQEQVPQLRDVYSGKVDIRDLGIDFKDDTVDPRHQLQGLNRCHL